MQFAVVNGHCVLFIMLQVHFAIGYGHWVPFPWCSFFQVALVLCIHLVALEEFVSPFWLSGFVVCDVALLGCMELQRSSQTAKPWHQKMWGCFFFFSRQVQPRFHVILWYTEKLKGAFVFYTFLGGISFGYPMGGAGEVSLNHGRFPFRFNHWFHNGVYGA